MVVVVGHGFEGWAPSVTTALQRTPLFGALNGIAAVIIFFVLSGFVLTVRLIEQRTVRAVPWLLLKRWPRLAGPVVAAGVVIVLIAWAGGFPAGANGPPYAGWGAAQQNSDAAAVLREAAVTTFWPGTNVHNPVLWTMHWELIGSAVAFALAAIVLLPVPAAIRAVLFAAVWWAAARYSVWLIGFPAGVLAAVVHRQCGARLTLPGNIALAAALLAALAMSWDIRQDNPGATAITAWIGLQTGTALLWIAVALYHPASRRRLSGRLGARAGRLSFAIYLLHLPILLSLGAWLFRLGCPVAILLPVCLVVIITVATPLAVFDGWWIGQLNRAVRATRAALAAGWHRTDTAC